MFTYSATTHDFFMTKRDSVFFTVDIEYDDGSAYTQNAGDTIYFTVRATVNAKVNLLQKTTTLAANNLISIDPEDTALIPTGTACVYDIELVRNNGDVHTIIPHSSFTVDWEVTQND